MADVSAQYTLQTNFTLTLFNTGVLGDGTDMYYLTDVSGLDGAPIRAPIDNAPQQHGGIAHTFWMGGRHVLMGGLILVQSTQVQNDILAIRNTMEDALRVALEDCLGATAQLAWGGKQLFVLNEIPLECSGVVERRFTFGLYAANPTMS